jgi:hypothetical protein
VKGLEQIHCGLRSKQVRLGPEFVPAAEAHSAHYLKIDRNYMAELPKHKENQEKIKEICDQAHHAGKLTSPSSSRTRRACRSCFRAGRELRAG